MPVPVSSVSTSSVAASLPGAPSGHVSSQISTQASVQTPSLRIGLMATDALRLVGLRAILGDGEACTVVDFSQMDLGDASDLSLAILDSSSATDVFELVATFRRLRPRLPLLVLGAQSDFEHIERIIGCGARGYLSHSANEAELRMAISVVSDGSIWAPRKVLARLLETSMKQRSSNRFEPVKFTPRELEVLRLLVLGHPNRQIAAALGVDEGTVKAHMGRLMRKAGVDNRTALTIRAIERQWA